MRPGHVGGRGAQAALAHLVAVLVRDARGAALEEEVVGHEVEAVLRIAHPCLPRQRLHHLHAAHAGASAHKARGRKIAS